MKVDKEAIERDREAWRVRARAAFKALGRGSKARCHRELKIPQPEISSLLSGRIQFSHWVLAMSRWLEIAPPTLGLSNAVAELTAVAERMTPAQQQLLLAMAVEIAGKKKT